MGSWKSIEKDYQKEIDLLILQMMRFSKGGLSYNDLMLMPLAEFNSYIKAINEIIKKENQE